MLFRILKHFLFKKLRPFPLQAFNLTINLSLSIYTCDFVSSCDLPLNNWCFRSTALSRHLSQSMFVIPVIYCLVTLANNFEYQIEMLQSLLRLFPLFVFFLPCCLTFVLPWHLKLCHASETHAFVCLHFKLLNSPHYLLCNLIRRFSLSHENVRLIFVYRDWKFAVGRFLKLKRVYPF